MNWKRYIFGALIVWVFIFFYEFLLHGVILSDSYQQIARILRPEEDMGRFFGLVLFGEFLLSFGFCYIFVKGRESSSLLEGVRFGLVAGVGFGVAASAIDFAVFPFPLALSAGMAIGYVIEMILSGIIIAWIYRPQTT